MQHLPDATDSSCTYWQALHQPSTLNEFEPSSRQDPEPCKTNQIDIDPRLRSLIYVYQSERAKGFDIEYAWQNFIQSLHEIETQEKESKQPHLGQLVWNLSEIYLYAAYNQMQDLETLTRTMIWNKTFSDMIDASDFRFSNARTPTSLIYEKFVWDILFYHSMTAGEDERATHLLTQFINSFGISELERWITQAMPEKFIGVFVKLILSAQSLGRQEREQRFTLCFKLFEHYFIDYHLHLTSDSCFYFLSTLLVLAQNVDSQEQATRLLKTLVQYGTPYLPPKVSKNEKLSITSTCHIADELYFTAGQQLRYQDSIILTIIFKTVLRRLIQVNQTSEISLLYSIWLRQILWLEQGRFCKGELSNQPSSSIERVFYAVVHQLIKESTTLDEHLTTLSLLDGMKESTVDFPRPIKVKFKTPICEGDSKKVISHHKKYPIPPLILKKIFKHFKLCAGINRGVGYELEELNQAFADWLPPSKFAEFFSSLELFPIENSIERYREIVEHPGFKFTIFLKEFLEKFDCAQIVKFSTALLPKERFKLIRQLSDLWVKEKNCEQLRLLAGELETITDEKIEVVKACLPLKQAIVLSRLDRLQEALVAASKGRENVASLHPSHSKCAKVISQLLIDLLRALDPSDYQEILRFSSLPEHFLDKTSHATFLVLKMKLGKINDVIIDLKQRSKRCNPRNANEKFNHVASYLSLAFSLLETFLKSPNVPATILETLYNYVDKHVPIGKEKPHGLMNHFLKQALNSFAIETEGEEVFHRIITACLKYSSTDLKHLLLPYELRQLEREGKIRGSTTDELYDLWINNFFKELEQSKHASFQLSKLGKVLACPKYQHLLIPILKRCNPHNYYQIFKSFSAKTKQNPEILKLPLVIPNNFFNALFMCQRLSQMPFSIQAKIVREEFSQYPSTDEQPTGGIKRKAVVLTKEKKIKKTPKSYKKKKEE